MGNYTDKYGVKYRDDGKTLDRCPLDITGQYIIPEGTISIGSNAFANCWDLESVVIPRSVAYIEGFAFNRCKNLKAIIIFSDKLNEIAISCFRFCAWLTIVARPEIIRQISSYTFLDSNLTLIKYPIDVSTGEYTFDGCKNWESKFIKKYLPNSQVDSDNNYSLDKEEDVCSVPEESTKSENCKEIQIIPEDNCSLEEREDVCYDQEETPIDVLMQHIDDLDPVQQALLGQKRPQKSNERENSPSRPLRPLTDDDWLPF